MSPAEALLQSDELSLDDLLFQEEQEVFAVTAYANERPPGGMAGRLDWRFQGVLSAAMRNGAITGKEGEITYLPCYRAAQKKTFHLFVIGQGASDSFGLRKPVSAEALAKLQKNLISLKIPRLGLSRSDWALSSDEGLARQLKGVPLWIIP